MGRPKAWLPWSGRTMIEHVVAQLAPVVDEVVVVTSESLDLPKLPARIVRDREPERGPLAGIREGLAAVECEFAFVTSTDAPFLTQPFVSRMLDVGMPCAPVSGGHVQVLCAVYPGYAWRDAERLLEAGRARPLDLLEALGFERVEFGLELDSALAPDGSNPPWHGFNTPESYLDAVRALEPSATAVVELVGRASGSSGPPTRTFPVGRLAEMLAGWPASAELIVDGRLADRFVARLGDRDLVRDLGVPIGPGERVRILEAGDDGSAVRS